MSAADLVMSTRSSAKPRAEVRRPEIVRWPTPVALRARSNPLKINPKSRGDDLSPCFCPRVKTISADRP